jgi:hypothetical protein
LLILLHVIGYKIKKLKSVYCIFCIFYIHWKKSYLSIVLVRNMRNFGVELHPTQYFISIFYIIYCSMIIITSIILYVICMYHMTYFATSECFLVINSELIAICMNLTVILQSMTNFFLFFMMLFVTNICNPTNFFYDSNNKTNIPVMANLPLIIYSTKPSHWFAFYGAGFNRRPWVSVYTLLMVSIIHSHNLESIKEMLSCSYENA